MSSEKFDAQRQKHQHVFDFEISTGKPSSLPLEWYITFAAERVANEEPQFLSPQNSELGIVPKMLHFVRYARAHPAIAELSALAALSAITQVMKVMRWDWYCLDYEDGDEAEIDFEHHWNTVRFPVGWKPLPTAAKLARERPVQLRVPRNQLFVQFVSMAWYLQRMVRQGDNILLPCHEVADELGCSHQTVWRMRELAKREGFLTEVKKGTYRGARGTGEAAEFRFATELFVSDGTDVWECDKASSKSFYE